MPDYTILVIDYEPRSIQKLSTLLRGAGYRVEVARDGLSGIEKFETVRPDLTLIEAMLPKKHGFEVCESIKKTPHGGSTPVVILTSVYKGRRYRWQARYQYGCDEYLERPVSDDSLLETVRRFLARSARAEAEESPDSPEPRPADTRPVHGKPPEVIPDP